MKKPLLLILACLLLLSSCSGGRRNSAIHSPATEAQLSLLRPYLSLFNQDFIISSYSMKDVECLLWSDSLQHGYLRTKDGSFYLVYLPGYYHLGKSNFRRIRRDSVDYQNFNHLKNLVNFPLLILSIDYNDDTTLIVNRRLLVHECFHLYYQNIPLFNINNISENTSEKIIHSVYNSNTRSILSNVYNSDPAYKKAVLEEIRMLQAAGMAALSHAPKKEVASLIWEFIDLRQNRYRFQDLAITYYEKFWEFTEGTAFFVAYSFLGTSHGIDEFSPEIATDYAYQGEYFIKSGILMCLAAQYLNPSEFDASFKPSVAVDLFELCKTVSDYK